MWQKFLIATILFYIFAILQNSFIAHFSFLGAMPNLLFVLFFLLIFFEGKNKTYAVFVSILAGLFLDIFSYNYLGPSIILLLVINFLLKKTKLMLRNTEEKYPFVYFLPLFVIYLLIYDLFVALYVYFIDSKGIITQTGLQEVFSVIYSTMVAFIFFYVYKNFLKKVN